MPVDRIEPLFKRCVDRWTLADPGECAYCGKPGVPVFLEPFGQRDACRPCWDQIVYGEDE